METRTPAPETTLPRELAAIAGKVMALAVRFPARAADLDILLDITEAVIEEVSARPPATTCVVVDFPGSAGR